jgi:hypothetical protein
MNRLLLAGLVLAGWAAAGIGQTPSTPAPMPTVSGTVTGQVGVPATGLVPVPSAPGVVGGGVVQAGSTGVITGVVTGNCGLTPTPVMGMTTAMPASGTMMTTPMTTTTNMRYDGGRRMRLRR